MILVVGIGFMCQLSHFQEVEQNLYTLLKMYCFYLLTNTFFAKILLSFWFDLRDLF